MPRKKDSEALKVNHIFPKEYELMEEMLSVYGSEGKIAFKEGCLKGEGIFHVKPELDLPYKIRSMSLSKESDYCVMNDLFKKVNKKDRCEADPLYISIHSNTCWKEHLFQMPEIEQILGIKRDFTVKKLVDVFQNPVLFLLHLCEVEGLEKVQRYWNSERGNDILNLIEEAISAYEEKREKIGFTVEQMEMVFVFFLGKRVADKLDLVKKQYKETDELTCGQHDETIQRVIDLFSSEDSETDESWAVKKSIGGWVIDKFEKVIELDKRYKKIAGKLNEIQKTIYKEISKTKTDKTVEIDLEKGEVLRFPRYMRTILIGIYCYYEKFPFTAIVDEFIDDDDEEQQEKEEKLRDTLWSKRKIYLTEKIDEELWKAYGKFYTYIYFMKRWELCNANIRNMFDNEKKVDTYLEKTYIFLVGTLARTFLEEERYKSAALDAFEKLYSVFLLYTETELVYKKVTEAVEYYAEYLSEEKYPKKI